MSAGSLRPRHKCRGAVTKRRRYVAIPSPVVTPVPAGGVLASILALEVLRRKRISPGVRAILERKAIARQRTKQAIALRKQGLTFREIGERLGVSHQTVSGLFHRYAKYCNPGIVRADWWHQNRRPARTTAVAGRTSFVSRPHETPQGDVCRQQQETA